MIESWRKMGDAMVDHNGEFDVSPGCIATPQTRVGGCVEEVTNMHASRHQSIYYRC